ncbi:hypothetical protein TNCT_403251 [Trichonephila clavata]|uniref:Uncharacterized protein n=1 Tax=Trichonephila clavata TaxID=2740835 RepID=A0A8X6JCW4_TRICU|nr:hypothetical protein TNCT_403251 [Trichonephila clavata]
MSLRLKACFKPVNGLLRHFKTQWILAEKLSQDLSRKVLILKQALPGSSPRFDITGSLSEPSLPGPIHYSTKLCFNLSLDNRGPFQDNNAVF